MHTYTDHVAVEAAECAREIEQLHISMTRWIDTAGEKMAQDCEDYLATVAEPQGGEDA